MAWTTPITWTFGQTVTAAQLNSQIRDNLNETSPAKATTAGGYQVATAANAMAERTIGHTFTSASDTTSSTSFTDLAGGAGPTVTATTGTSAIVFLTASSSNSGTNLNSMGFDISGASTVAAVDMLRHTSAIANANVTASYAALALLNAGSNTFVAKYKVAAGTGTWSLRRLIVQSF